MTSNKRVFVWNVPFDCAENDLAECARTYGSIRHVYLPEKKPGKAKSGALNSGYGYIEFATAEIAEKFIKATKDGEVTLGDGEQMRAIRADAAKPKKVKKSPPEEKKATPTSFVPSKSDDPIDWSETEVHPPPAKKNSGPFTLDGQTAEKLPENSGNHEKAEPMEVIKPTEDGSGIFQRLPAELWSRLLSYIDLPSLIRLKRVNRQMLRIVNVTIANMLTLDLSFPPIVQLSPNGDTFASKFTHVDHYLLSRIFSKSNRWQSLRRLKLSSDKVRITPNTVRILASRLRSLEDLSICCHRVVNTCFRRVFIRNRSLRRLNLNARSGSFSLQAIHVLLRSCRSLTHLALDLSKIQFNFVVDVNPENLESISALSAKLFAKKSQQIRFFSCKTKPDDSVKFETLMCATFPTLVVAHLSTIPSVPLVCLRQLVLPRLPVGMDQSVWTRLPCLESLSVSATPGTRPPGADLAFMASPNCHVSEIALRDCEIRDTDLMYLQRMKALDLRNNCTLKDDDLKTFLNSNPNVERLGLRGLCEITGNLLRFIATSCPRLKLLNIADCPKIDNEAVQGIVSAQTSGPTRSPITIIAPGCKIDADVSFTNMLKTAGVMLFCNWGDISRMPVVGHFEPGVVDNVSEEEWPLTCRTCIAHRASPVIDINDFDLEEDEDENDFENPDVPDFDPSDFEDDDNDVDSWDELNG